MFSFFRACHQWVRIGISRQVFQHGMYAEFTDSGFVLNTVYWEAAPSRTFFHTLPLTRLRGGGEL
jgi:hypothetical protein